MCYVLDKCDADNNRSVCKFIYSPVKQYCLFVHIDIILNDNCH